MANVSFVRTDPENLSKEAAHYLRLACERSRLSVITLESCFQTAAEGKAIIFEVLEGQKLVGCVTFSFRETETDLYLELPLLGGVNLRDWRDDLVSFIFELAEKYSCSKFTMIGRKGFEKLFPEMKLLCCVYGRDF